MSEKLTKCVRACMDVSVFYKGEFMDDLKQGLERGKL